ncbi:MAG: hypothetical protein M3T96_03870, partial [Acidobacteriota bacterium]|nr:hypothetical protein [Acidobacteriota bacterium]
MKFKMLKQTTIVLGIGAVTFLGASNAAAQRRDRRPQDSDKQQVEQNQPSRQNDSRRQQQEQQN